MAHPDTAGIDSVPDARKLHEPLNQLEHCINRQEHVACPVDKSAQRNPNEVWIVPSCLACELLDAAQNTGNHETEKTGPRRICVCLTVREAQNPECEEQRCERGHDDVAHPVR